MGIQISVAVSGETERRLVEWAREHLEHATYNLEALGRRVTEAGGPEAFFAPLFAAGHAPGIPAAPATPPESAPPLRPAHTPEELHAALVPALSRIAASPKPGRALLHELRARAVFDAVAEAGGFPAAMVAIFGGALLPEVVESFQRQIDTAALAEADIPRLEREVDAAEKAMARTEVEEQAKPNPPGADLARLKASLDILAASRAALAEARAGAANRPPGIPEDTAAWARAIIAQASLSAQLPPEIIGFEEA